MYTNKTMNNKDIIAELNKIDLSLYPYDEVKKLVYQFKPKILTITIPQRELIVRMRSGTNIYERIEVSYRPANKNTIPQRATLPFKTAFYGTFTHTDDPSLYCRITALSECSKLCRNGVLSEGTEPFTLSYWETMEPIHFAIFAYNTIYPNVTKNKLLNNSKIELNKRLSTYNSEEEAVVYLKYVSEQFAKPVIPDNNHEYIIPATIADTLMYGNKIEGIMYPSVRTEGEYGMNVALRPDIADNKLKLTDVYEIEYIQNAGRGCFISKKKAVPSITDNHGYKHWFYEPIQTPK